jgi:hypothetical protein
MTQARPAHAGRDLLPSDFGAQRDEYLVLVGAAYASVMGNALDNFKHWHRATTAVSTAIKTRYAALGLTAPPWAEAALWARVELPVPSSKPLAHMWLLRALLTDFHDSFWGQFEYRLRTGGNVHLQLCGPTGLAKSSCAITIAHDVKRMEPDRLLRHLSIDVGELPEKLKDKQAGDTVILDEFLKTAGEGSRTTGSLMENLEDTLRASQVNLFVSSPRRNEHGTMQAQLEVILWNPEAGWSLFLVWIDGLPHGVVALPWCPPALYAVYKTWKDGNVQRTLEAQFSDNSYLARMVAKVCDDSRFVKFLVKARGKPKLKDFKTALTLFQPQMMAGATSEKLAGFMHDLFYGWDQIGSDLKDWFGITSSPGMTAIAQKCYEE